MTRFLHTFIALLLIFTPAISVKAHESIGEWQIYRSYCNATSNVVMENYVFSLCDGNLFRYNTEDTEVRTYDKLHALNDVHITAIAACPQAKRLIIVYDNANIDLMDMDEEVLNIASLKNSTMAGKEVNSILVDGTMAYLCTSFGMVTLDVKEGIIQDTFNLGLAVKSACLLGDDIWIATSQGIFYAPATGANLHFMDAWTRRVNSVNTTQMAVHGDYVYGMTPTGVNLFNKSTFRTILLGKMNFLRTLADGTPACADNNMLYLLSEDGASRTIHCAKPILDLAQKGNIYWASTGTNGLYGYALTDAKLSLKVGPIQPNSPLRDLSYRISFAGDQMLVAGGVINYNNVNLPGTAMMLKDGEWVNFTDEYLTLHPDVRHYTFTHVAQDPQDASHHFVSSFRNGLYEFRGGRFTKLYNCDNSPIRSILPDNDNRLSYCSAGGAQYDDEGNLWIINNETDTIIRYMEPNGRWRSLYYEEVKGAPTCTDYLFTSSGVRMLLSMRYSNLKGIFAFHPGNTLSNVRDDKHILRSTITNQDGTSYNPSAYYAIAEDLDGRIWCGTDVGLFVINDANAFFDKDFEYEQIKIPRNDGSGLADYLMNGVAITCILVDDANRKWIGTSDNGLYLVSSDGQELLQHFLASDSPLLSNNIQCLAIEPATGRLMIGTDIGLCSYMTDSKAPESTLDENNVIAYPNPVSPDYNGPITLDGLTMDAEVKICSSSGQLIVSGTSNGGRFVWNGCNAQGKRVSSGVYHVISNTSDGKKAIVSRIIVIR